MKLQSKEAFREYHYPDRGVLRIENVTAVDVTRSGFHKLDTEDGRKLIVAPGWRHIELSADQWTF